MSRNRSRISSRLTIWSMSPCLSRNSALWKPGGSACLVVSRMTRAPANPIDAPGSAMITSPKVAKLAVTPPMVGSVRMEIKGRPAAASRPKAALVFAICISEKMPSCMRAPPEALTTTHGIFSRRAASMARVIFSPTALPMAPPQKRKSITATATGMPWIRPAPQTTASARPLSRSYFFRRSG